MPLTLAILATLLQMHGADATITSDNLPTDIRPQLQEQVDPDAARIIQIDAKTRTIQIKPGTAGSQLKAQLKPTERRAPPSDKSTIKALPKSDGSRR